MSNFSNTYNVASGFGKSSIVLRKIFGEILSRSRHPFSSVLMNTGDLLEEFRVQYSSENLSNSTFFVRTCLSNCQSFLRRSANGCSILWLSKIIIEI